MLRECLTLQMRKQRQNLFFSSEEHAPKPTTSCVCKIACLRYNLAVCRSHSIADEARYLQAYLL